MGCNSSTPHVDNHHKNGMESMSKTQGQMIANKVHELHHNSNAVSKEEQEEADCNLEDLESFVQLCLYRGNKIQAIKMFLQDESALLALVKFLSKDDVQIRGLKSGTKGSALQEIFKASAEFSEANKAVENLVEKYHRNPEPEDDAAKHRGSNNRRTTVENPEVMFKQNEALALTAASVLPKFITSPQFQEWREKEASKSHAETNRSLREMIEAQEAATRGAMLNFMDKKTCKDRDAKYYLKTRSSYQSLSSYTLKAFVSLDPLEVKNIAKSKYLSTFLGAVEGLPICVSLSTASQNRRGFPLIYVNSIFEETTGYSRDEIVGRNCSFLQRSNTGAESESEYFTIKLLSEALKDAKPVYATITNYRKNGEKFKNLLAMKPLFDADGVYSYVVGLQFEVSNVDGKHRSLATVNDLLSMLPDRLPRD